MMCRRSRYDYENVNSEEDRREIPGTIVGAGLVPLASTLSRAPYFNGLQIDNLISFAVLFNQAQDLVLFDVI